MADAIEITKSFPASRERTVLLELLKIARTLKQENIEAVICGGWVPFLKELAKHSQTTHSMSLDIDVLLRAKAREQEAIDRIKNLHLTRRKSQTKLARVRKPNQQSQQTINLLCRTCFPSRNPFLAPMPRQRTGTTARPQSSSRNRKADKELAD